MKRLISLIYPVIFLCVVLFTLSCSSSSGGGDDIGGGAEEISSLSLPNPLVFTVHDPWTGEDYPDTDLLSASIYSIEEGEIANISIINYFTDSPGIHMVGTYKSDTEETTLTGGNSYMWIDSGDLFGVMGLSIPSGVSVVWTGTDDPTSGSFLIDYKGNAMEYNFIRVVVNPNVNESGNAGVDISVYNNLESDPVSEESYTWEEFDDLEENGVEAYQRIASFCYGVWESVFERVGNCFNTTALFLEYSEDLYNQGGSATISIGSIFPQTGERGSATCSWTDNNDNDEMGDTDDFSLSLTNLWEDDEDDYIDEMYNGTLSLYGLLLDIDDTNDVITTIGGNFEFGGFKIQETLYDHPDNYELDDEYVIFNGGFNITAYAY